MTIYVSFDIEANGPVPGKNSMLSIGAIAYDKFGNELTNISINFEEAPDTREDVNTMVWWQNFLHSYEESRKFVVSPEQGMTELDRWLSYLERSNNDRVVMVASPSALDVAYFRHYYKYVKNPMFDIGFSCFDLQSAMATHLKIPFELCLMPKFWPITWKSNMPPYTHISIDDARFQGELFFRFAKDAGLVL